MANTDNPHCPDYSPHFENAVERMFPSGAPAVLSADQDEAASADAEAEYRACEGH